MTEEKQDQQIDLEQIVEETKQKIEAADAANEEPAAEEEMEEGR